MSSEELLHVVSLHFGRKRGGECFAPHLDPIALRELSVQMTAGTPRVGCGAVDILHVTAARLCDATLFVTADCHTVTTSRPPAGERDARK